MKLKITYYITFGSGDSSDYMTEEFDINPHQMKKIKEAIKDGTPFYQIDRIKTLRNGIINKIERLEEDNLRECGLWDEIESPFDYAYVLTIKEYSL